MQGGSAYRQDGGSGEAHRDALTARRPAKDSKGRPDPGSGAHTVGEIPDGERTSTSFPQEPVLGIGSPVSCPGEVLLWQSSKYPGGTTMANGKRGNLVGAIPEALCVEAPEGQSMIRGENLEAVCVEAPQGQPRNHRHHPKQVMGGPTGERREKEKRQPINGPPSSLWTKVAKNEDGPTLQNQCPESWALLG